MEIATEQERSALWKKTGIVTLREAGLTALPPEVWHTGAAAQVANFERNTLQTLSREFSQLTALQKLHLSHNQLTDGGVPSGVFAAFRQLQVLAISHNRHAFLHSPHITLNQLSQITEVLYTS